MQIIELLTPAYEAAWLPWAVQYFFLVGVATGAALLACACVFGAPGSPSQRVLPALLLTLAVSVVAAPVSLLADLHQPARFWHFYAHFTPWSWMSVGALLLPVFVTLSVALLASWWLGRPGWMRAIAPLLVLSALSITVYTGAEMMVTPRVPPRTMCGSTGSPAPWCGRGYRCGCASSDRARRQAVPHSPPTGHAGGLFLRWPALGASRGAHSCTAEFRLR